MMETARIGLVGFGYIGSAVYGEITRYADLGLEVAFVHDVDDKRLSKIPDRLVLKDLGDFASVRTDLIVELAHPEVSQKHGCDFLEVTDYMPLSVTALADAALEAQMLASAEANGTSLFIPHGTAIGLEALEEGRDFWDDVTFTMRKPASSVDHSALPATAQRRDDGVIVLYDGTTRGICPLFPRNVNSHAAVALAGIGFDRTRSVFISDPGLDRSAIHLEARGSGVEMSLQRFSPITGVSSAVVLNSVRESIARVKGKRSTLQIC